MNNHCPNCNREFSVEDFDFSDETSVLCCPQCGAAVPAEVSEALREEFEEEWVVCPACGVYSRADELLDIPEEPTEWCCPACGALYSAEDQRMIAEILPHPCWREVVEDMDETMFPDGHDEDEDE